MGEAIFSVHDSNLTDMNNTGSHKVAKYPKGCLFVGIGSAWKALSKWNIWLKGPMIYEHRLRFGLAVPRVADLKPLVWLSQATKLVNRRLDAVPTATTLARHRAGEFPLSDQPLEWWRTGTIGSASVFAWLSPAVRSRPAVTGYFRRKQLPPFDFAGCPHHTTLFYTISFISLLSETRPDWRFM